MILELFLAFLQVGALSIGGGYVAMPLLQSLTVNSHHWLTMQEFADLISIAEMTPGPIAINAATFIGVRLGGAGGIAAAVVGFITPSLVLVTLLGWLYGKYSGAPLLQQTLSSLRPAVAALIASAALSLFQLAAVQWTGIVLFAAALFFLRWKKPSPILVLALCGAAGILLHALGII